MIRTSGPVPREFKHRALPLSAPHPRSQTVTLAEEEVALLKQGITAHPSTSSQSKGMPGLHHEVFSGKDNATAMVAPGHLIAISDHSTNQRGICGGLLQEML